MENSKKQNNIVSEVDKIVLKLGKKLFINEQAYNLYHDFSRFTRILMNAEVDEQTKQTKHLREMYQINSDLNSIRMEISIKPENVKQHKEKYISLYHTLVYHYLWLLDNNAM